MTCEACNKTRVQANLQLTNKDGEYALCLNCLIALVNLRLSKAQFKALLKHEHSVDEFFLHSDFYDSKGNALQSR